MHVQSMLSSIDFTCHVIMSRNVLLDQDSVDIFPLREGLASKLFSMGWFSWARERGDVFCFLFPHFPLSSISVSSFKTVYVLVDYNLFHL